MTPRSRGHGSEYHPEPGFPEYGCPLFVDKLAPLPTWRFRYRGALE